MNMQDAALNCAAPKACQLATYLIATLTVVMFCKTVILWDATLGQQYVVQTSDGRLVLKLLKIKS
jgi:hypothetical protein